MTFRPATLNPAAPRRLSLEDNSTLQIQLLTGGNGTVVCGVPVGHVRISRRLDFGTRGVEFGHFEVMDKNNGGDWNCEHDR